MFKTHWFETSIGRHKHNTASVYYNYKCLIVLTYPFTFIYGYASCTNKALDITLT